MACTTLVPMSAAILDPEPESPLPLTRLRPVRAGDRDTIPDDLSPLARAVRVFCDGPPG